MNWQRIAVLGILSATLAALLARAATPVPSPPRPTPPVTPVIDTTSLDADIDRLRARLRPPDSRATPTRNLFDFRHDGAPAARAPRTAANPPSVNLPPPRPAWRMIGIAEDAGADGQVVRTAIVTSASGVHLLKVGDSLDGLHVVAVGSGAVEFAGDGDAAPIVLTLD